ncbi:MAG TPA: class I SAM-dependent methyltransferase [Vicinamibacterales bacterium]|nr:class I SAM-dependent methyltransferase [Vicinamibacterales bacterium]
MTIDPEQHELTALAARLPRGEACRVVEIGCGDGRLTRRYSGRVASVVAIDTDRQAIADFRASGPEANVSVHLASLEDFSAPDASVDAVLFSWSL